MPENETPASTNGSTPEASSTAPPTGQAAPPSWTAGAHSRFAGRTAEEILGIAEGLASVAERFNQPVTPPTPEPRNRFDFDIPDDEYVSGQKLKQIVQHFVNQPTPVDTEARQQNAANAWGMAEIKYPDEFKRWKQEIWNEASKLPIHLWNLDNLAQIVRIVRSNHIDELAAEKAQRLVDESHPTIRSGTGGSVSGPQTQQSLSDEGIPKEWVQQARSQGITESQIREFCELAGITERQYYADLVKYGKGGLIRG